MKFVLASNNAKKLAEISGLPLLLTTAPDWLTVENTIPITDITKKLF